MKKLGIAFLLVLFLGSAPAFSAGGKFSLALSAEAVVPIGDFAKSFNIGYGIGETLSYRFLRMLSVFADMTFQFVPRDNSDYGPNMTASGGSFRFLSIVPGVKVIFPAGNKIDIFGLSGFGVFFRSRSDLDVRGQGWWSKTYWYSNTKVGFVLGGGTEFSVSKAISLVPEFRLTLILLEDDVQSYLSFRFGGKYKF